MVASTSMLQPMVQEGREESTDFPDFTGSVLPGVIFTIAVTGIMVHIIRLAGLPS